MSLNIPIRADIDSLKGDLNKAVTIVSDASQQFAQAADKASARAKGGVDAILASGNSLKQQYRQLSREAIDLADKYGAMDARALKAAQAAGEIKDKIEDTNVVINAFKADSKFTVVAGAMQQAAGAASVVTGAMGLLGVKSEETQQMLLKVQSALALTQGLAQLKEMQASFIALNAVIQTSVIPSLMTMQGALIATGIGALVVAVGLLTKAAIDYNAEIDATLTKEKELAAQRKESAKIMADAVKNQLNDRAIYLKTIAKGYERERAEIELSKQQAIQAEKDKFEASNKTYVDKARLINNIKNIEKAAAVELTEIESKYSEQRTKKQKDELSKRKAADKEAFELRKKYNEIEFKQGEKFYDSMAAMKAAELDVDMSQLEKATAELPRPEIPIKVILDKAAQNEAMAALKESWQKFGDMMRNMLANVGASASYALGAALAGGEDFGATMKKTLASLMQQVGTALIAMGVAYKVTGIGAGYGAVLVGSGIALNIAAGALSASAGGGSAGGGGGASVTAPTIGGGDFNANIGGGVGGGFNNFMMRTEGKDLVLAMQRTGRYNKRG